MLDYDGTLAPFHIDRFPATPYPGVEDRLETLSTMSQVRLVLVSGGSAPELHDLLRPGIRMEIWGSHGREHLGSDGTYEQFALDPAQQRALEEVGLEMSDLGLPATLEVKPSSLAVHWRSFEPSIEERIRSAVRTVFPALINRTRCTCYPSMVGWSCVLRPYQGNRGGGDPLRERRIRGSLPGR